MLTYPSDFPTTCRAAPADLAKIPPPPGFNSRLWISIPTGIYLISIELPDLISTSSPEIIFSPAFTSFGASI